MAAIRAGESSATRADSMRFGTVVSVSRFTTQARGIPSARDSATSDGIPRARVVTGATVTRSRTV